MSRSRLIVSVFFFSGVLLSTLAAVRNDLPIRAWESILASGLGPEAAETTPAAYLPLAFKLADLREPLPAPVPISVEPPVDFESARAELQAEGLDLAFNKIGFHVGPGGNRTGLGEWMRELDDAGVPFFLKSVDDAGPIFEAQNLMKASGVPHILVYRRSGSNYDVPDYNLAPAEAAQEHWQLHKDVFPPELDPRLVWIETINEVSKDRSDWLGHFAYETAQLAMADGFRWAAFGWSSGEPEPEHWETPGMLRFLKLAGDNPDQVAVALHEYSYDRNDIGRWYPYLLGRFQAFFQIVDSHYIRRPTILITEWGWEYQDVPGATQAMDDIRWASWLYAAYPQVKGAAVWYLGPGFGGIADQAQKLIAPVRDYSLSNYFEIVPGEGGIDPTLFEPSAGASAVTVKTCDYQTNGWRCPLVPDGIERR